MSALMVAGALGVVLVLVGILISAHRSRSDGRVGSAPRSPTTTGLPGYMPGIALGKAPVPSPTTARVEPPAPGGRTVDLDGNVARLRPKD